MLNMIFIKICIKEDKIETRKLNNKKKKRINGYHRCSKNGGLLMVKTNY